MEKENVQFRKNFIWNVLGTGLNAFNSLFFMIIVTRLNGVDQAGIFTIAFSTACIIYFVGVYAGRIYQVTELNKEITDKEFIVNRSISTILMLILVILFSVILFFIIDYITKNMITSTISIILVNIIILIVFDFKNVLKFVDLKTKVKKENILKIFKSGFFTFAISFLGVYILNAPKYAIDSFLAENYQTIFGIIVMPATVIGLVAQFLIHPYLNKIVELYKNRDLKNLNKLILKLIFMIVAFGIISSLLAYFLGPEVLGLVYGIDLKVYRIGLLIIIISATLYTIGVIYSSVLTAVRETFSQFIAYIIISLFAIVCSNILTKQKEMNGAVIAYFAIMSLQFIIYTTYTNIKLRKIFNKEEENE